MLQPFSMAIGNKKFVIIAETFEEAREIINKDFHKFKITHLKNHGGHETKLEKIGDNIFYHCIPCDIVYYNTAEVRPEFHGVIATFFKDEE